MRACVKTLLWVIFACCVTIPIASTASRSGSPIIFNVLPDSIGNGWSDEDPIYSRIPPQPIEGFIIKVYTQLTFTPDLFRNKSEPTAYLYDAYFQRGCV